MGNALSAIRQKPPPESSNTSCCCLLLFAAQQQEMLFSDAENLQLSAVFVLRSEA